MCSSGASALSNKGAGPSPYRANVPGYTRHCVPFCGALRLPNLPCIVSVRSPRRDRPDVSGAPACFSLISLRFFFFVVATTLRLLVALHIGSPPFYSLYWPRLLHHPRQKAAINSCVGPAPWRSDRPSPSLPLCLCDRLTLQCQTPSFSESPLFPCQSACPLNRSAAAADDVFLLSSTPKRIATQPSAKPISPQLQFAQTGPETQCTVVTD